MSFFTFNFNRFSSATSKKLKRGGLTMGNIFECRSRIEQNLHLYYILKLRSQNNGKKEGNIQKTINSILHQQTDCDFGCTKIIIKTQSSKQIITWNSSGNGFIIVNETELINKLLPQHFKHRNLASFVRQLNLYGFHKIENAYQYFHEHFKRDRPEQLKLIKRIIPVKKKKILNVAKRKQQSKILVENRQQYDKLTQENQKLKEENKKLAKGKTQYLKLLRKLKACTRKTKKTASKIKFSQNQQTEIIRQKQQKHLQNQMQLEGEVQMHNIDEMQKQESIKDQLFSDEKPDDILSQYFS